MSPGAFIRAVLHKVQAGPGPTASVAPELVRNTESQAPPTPPESEPAF